MNFFNKATDDYQLELHRHIQISKDNNEKIQKKLITVFGKFEKLMHLEQRVVSTDTHRRDKLLEAQESLIKKMSNPVQTSSQSGMHI